MATLKPNWEQQAIQIPSHIREQFEAVHTTVDAGVKWYGTAAIALILGMPDHVREGLFDHVLTVGYRDPAKLNPADVFTRMMELTKHNPLLRVQDPA